MRADSVCSVFAKPHYRRFQSWGRRRSAAEIATKAVKNLTEMEAEKMEAKKKYWYSEISKQIK